MIRGRAIATAAFAAAVLMLSACAPAAAAPAAATAAAADRRTADDVGADAVDHGVRSDVPVRRLYAEPRRPGQARRDHAGAARGWDPGAKVVVYGYTDNQPVGKALKRKGIVDNLDLSSKRANEVVRYLTSKGDQPQHHLGQGPRRQHPVARERNAAGPGAEPPHRGRGRAAHRLNSLLPNRARRERHFGVTSPRQLPGRGTMQLGTLLPLGDIGGEPREWCGNTRRPPKRSATIFSKRPTMCSGSTRRAGRAGTATPSEDLFHDPFVLFGYLAGLHARSSASRPAS